MKYLVIEAPSLTDEAVIQLQDFFAAWMNAFEESYHYQAERYYRNLSNQNSDNDNKLILETEPPF